MAYTTIDDPSAHFHVQLYTSNNGYEVSVVNDANAGDFKPDLLWVKSRFTIGGYDYNHDWIDSSRGRAASFHTNLVNAESTASQSTYDLISFDTDGFTTGAPEATNSLGGGNLGKVAWQWKVNGGTTASNTSGSLTSTVQVNATAGISMFTFTANGTTTDVGHGLGSKPDLVIFKSRNVGGGHLMITDLLDGSQDYLYLNSPNAKADIGYAVHSSSVVEYNDNNNNTQIAYAFKNIQGYSKFGTYYGNGVADGTFAYCGFKPAFVMIKNTGSSEPWVIFDTKRDPYHQPDAHNKLVANSTDAENGHSATGGSGYNNIDMLSTGFKVVTNNGATNESGKRFLFMAFAESPFVSSEGIPTTGR